MHNRGVILSGTLLALFLHGPAPMATMRAAQAAEQPAQTEPFGRFSIPELEAKMQAAKAGKLALFIYDNNSIERYKKGHVPGARWIDYEKIRAADLPQDKNATLVFYCANEH
jgi:hypothetical protein